ncbi:hypothetical protein GCM10010344_45540 [Streptomyces bluensis]|nr:hypothetical protein GCM10010344_45540 [Streptomyces bluensis]
MAYLPQAYESLGVYCGRGRPPGGTRRLSRPRRPYPSHPQGLRPFDPNRGSAPDPVPGAGPRTPAPQTPEGLNVSPSGA